jgi:hypothetical protein
LCGHFTAKGIRVDVIDESALAVDLYHRQPFPVARFQLGVAGDLDLLELERDLLPNLGDDRPGALTEVAALRVVEDDLTDKCRGS